jgi:molecular chaperone DnaK
LPSHISGRLNAALDALRQALDNNADIDRLRKAKEELEQAYSQACQCKSEEPKQNQVNKDGNQTRRNDDAIDVEYE